MTNDEMIIHLRAAGYVVEGISAIDEDADRNKDREYVYCVLDTAEYDGLSGTILAARAHRLTTSRRKMALQSLIDKHLVVMGNGIANKRGPHGRMYYLAQYAPKDEMADNERKKKVMTEAFKAFAPVVPVAPTLSARDVMLQGLEDLGMSDVEIEIAIGAYDKQHGL